MKKLLIIALIFLLSGCSKVDLGASSDISATALANKYNSAKEIKAKYAIDGVALKSVPKADPKDTIRVTVGNETTGLGAESEFVPSVKISRWDEVSMKLTPKGLDKISSRDKKVSFEGNKIKYETPKVDYKMYDLPKSKDNEEGAYEIEAVLKEKPATNVVEFNIETQGVEFNYQPFLKNENSDGSTWEEEDGDISTRPENINGSYAVYYENGKSGDFSATVGKKNYKAGKMGHIYRPKIIDAKGNWVWGEYNKDLQETKNLTVTVPQDFLDKAVYPVVVDPTFGYTSVPATGSTWAVDTIRGWEYTITEVGTVYAIMAYGASGSGYNSYLRGTIYGEGTTGARITYGGQLTIANTDTVNSWRYLEVTRTVLTASTVYKIGWWHDVSTGTTGWVSPYDAGLTQHRFTLTYHATNAPSAAWTETSSTADRKTGVYARYSCISGTCTDTYANAGTYSWTAPTDVSSVNVACWGGGGGGVAGDLTDTGGGGGGGGAYAASTGISVTAGNSYTVVVGSGGTGGILGGDAATSGTDSTFDSTVVVADAGTTGSTYNKGTGGTTANSTGSVKYAGGDGGDGVDGTNEAGGGGGGGAAGPDGIGGNGTNASGSTSGDGGTGDNGSGGAGATVDGVDGSNSVLGGGGGAGAGAGASSGGDGGWYGAGGGGGKEGNDGGNGADGACTITYTITSTAPSSSACFHLGGDWYINQTCYIGSNTSTPGTLYIGTGGILNCIDNAIIEVDKIEATRGTKINLKRGCKIQERTY